MECAGYGCANVSCAVTLTGEIVTAEPGSPGPQYASVAVVAASASWSGADAPGGVSCSVAAVSRSPRSQRYLLMVTNALPPGGTITGAGGFDVTTWSPPSL